MTKSRENVVNEFNAILNQGAQFGVRGTQKEDGTVLSRPVNAIPVVNAESPTLIHDGEIPVQEGRNPFNVLADPTDLGLGVDAFNPEDDELNMTREEMIAQLGPDEKKVRAKVMVDALTGEKSITPINEDQDVPESLADIQPLNPDDIRKQFSQIARQNIMMLIPDTMSDSDADALVAKLEAQVIKLSRSEIKGITEVQAKDMLGDILYNGISKFNPKPLRAARTFLLDLKASVTEGNSVINAIEEVNASMEFFQRAGINDMEAEIKASMESEDTYPTPLHHYRQYLIHYVERLKSDPLYFSNAYVKAEIETCESRVKALDEAFTFKRVIEKGFNIKGKIQKDFKDRKMVLKAIHDFVGKLNNDPSIVVSFPVPKNVSDKEATPEYLTSVWMIFVAMLETYRMFPALDQLSYMDYGDLANIVSGETKIEYDEEGEPLDERLETLRLFAEEHGITKNHLRQSENFSVVFCYVMARAYKPNDLNNMYIKYVLSFTMNILTQSMNHKYRAFTHEAFAVFYNILGK